MTVGPRPRWNAAAAGGLLLLVAHAVAQDALQGLLPPQDGPQQARVLVLKTGQVLQGEVEARLGGYTVRLTSGSIVVPYDQVRTAAASLDDAYQRLRADLHNPNANDRIELARWCQKLGLPVAARTEVIAALQLEPQRSDARALLIELERGLPARTTESGDFAPAARLSTPAALPAVTAGLSGDRVAEYVRQVQPLLLNSCASAACHGGTQAGGLQLRMTARTNRHDSQLNLEAVLKFIDTHAPDASPLIAIPRQGAGPHATAFRGTKSKEQLDRLRTWTWLVAREFAAEERPDSGVPAGGVIPAAGTASDAPPPVDDAFLRRIVDEQRGDAFDPAEFNRQVHGIVPPGR